MGRRLLKPILLASAVILGFSATAYSFNFNMAGMFKAFYQLTGYYGNGADGALTVNGAINGPSAPVVINTATTYLTSDVAASSTTLTVNSIAGFASSDEVLIITMEGAKAGKMEFGTISAVGGSTITLSSGVTNSFAAAGKVQVVKVARYTNVTINSGGFISANSYNTTTGTGGVLVMKVSGTLTINDGGGGLSGHISMGGGHANFGNSRGYPGGAAGAGYGQSGSGTGGSGSNGGSNNSPGVDERLIMGSGAGATSGTGGAGGGVVIVKAQSLVLNGGGAIRSEGYTPTSGVAGGGAGGTIQIYTDSLTTSTTCGSISAAGGSAFGGGTAGGNGRVFVNYRTTLNCKTAAPTATSNYLKFNLK